MTITERVSSKYCDAPTAEVGATLTYSIGSPRMDDEDAGCMLESGSPPSGNGTLYGIAYDSCFEVLGGFGCVGHPEACLAQDAGVNITVGIPPSARRVGEEGDGTYTVDLMAQAQGECPVLSCVERFKTHVKRVR